MKKRSKAFSAPATPSASSGSNAQRLAAKASFGLGNADLSLEAVLQIEPLTTSPPSEFPLSAEALALKEVAIARAFNFELPADPIAALDRIEETLRDLLDVRHCALLTFNEQTGLYTCLDDLRYPGQKVRTLSRISDWFLQELFGTGHEVLHSHLLSENGLIGLIVLTEKRNGQAFNATDQILLDLLIPYLSVQVDRLQSLKELIAAPYIQQISLELAESLMTAVDQDSIIPTTLDILCKKLGFDACQYVQYNEESNLGEVLYDIKATGKLQSYSHAGLEGKRRTIPDYANWVGLLSSVARNRLYLQLNGKKLGERSLGEIFGVRNIQSALLLPVTQIETGRIRGTLNLFHTHPTRISDESRDIALEAARLTSCALSRAQVLEKALAMASSDELTGLINRRGYYQRFEAELERARRHQTPLCVALIDVDHFKILNDSHGHLSGDLVLKTLSDLFSQNLRKSDVICRFGGEEFAILLPDTSLKTAADLLERVRSNTENMQFQSINQEALHVTISIGLAAVDSKPKASLHCSEISEALAHADEQLYAAKNGGRNRVCYEVPSGENWQFAV